MRWFHALTRIPQLSINKLQRQRAHTEGGHRGQDPSGGGVFARGSTQQGCDTATPQARQSRLDRGQPQQGAGDGHPDPRRDEGVDAQILIVREITRAIPAEGAQLHSAHLLTKKSCREVDPATESSDAAGGGSDADRCPRNCLDDTGGHARRRGCRHRSGSEPCDGSPRRLVLSPGQETICRNGSDDDEGIPSDLAATPPRPGSQAAERAVRRDTPGVACEPGNPGDDSLIQAAAGEQVGLVRHPDTDGGEHQARPRRGIQVPGHRYARKQ